MVCRLPAAVPAGRIPFDTVRFDTVDLVLDLVVAPDRSWQLKDEDDFQRAISDGHLTAEAGTIVRAEAERMIAVSGCRRIPIL